MRHMVFFVMELETRKVNIAGIRIAPDDAWSKQIARNLVDCCDGFLRNAIHPIHDRDPLCSKAWRTVLGANGVECVRIPRHSPDCNPFAERFVRSIGIERLNHFVIVGERPLRHHAREYVDHVDSERYHQGLGAGSSRSLTNPAMTMAFQTGCNAARGLGGSSTSTTGTPRSSRR